MKGTPFGVSIKVPPCVSSSLDTRFSLFQRHACRNPRFAKSSLHEPSLRPAPKSSSLTPNVDSVLHPLFLEKKTKKGNHQLKLARVEP